MSSKSKRRPLTARFGDRHILAVTDYVARPVSIPGEETTGPLIGLEITGTKPNLTDERTTLYVVPVHYAQDLVDQLQRVIAQQTVGTPDTP